MGKKLLLTLMILIILLGSCNENVKEELVNSNIPLQTIEPIIIETQNEDIELNIYNAFANDSQLQVNFQEYFKTNMGLI